jgi:hypothetical protein
VLTPRPELGFPGGAKILNGASQDVAQGALIHVAQGRDRVWRLAHQLHHLRA